MSTVTAPILSSKSLPLLHWARPLANTAAAHVASTDGRSCPR
jgi:hypothetical protein